MNNYKPIVVEGNVTNAQDEEDLTAVNGLLKLKDRSSLEGMGYVILRKNKTFKEQVEGKPNTIFEVRYDFAVGGTEANPVNVPENCVLKFEGGRLDNGHLNFNGCEIKGKNGCFGVNIEFTGEMSNTHFEFDWFTCDRSITLAQYKSFVNVDKSEFGTVPDISSVNSTLLKKVLAYNIKFGEGIYAFDSEIPISKLNIRGINDTDTLLWFPLSNAFNVGNSRFVTIEDVDIEASGNVVYVNGNATENVIAMRVNKCTILSYRDHCFFIDYTKEGHASGVFYEARFTNLRMYCGEGKGFFTNITSNSNYYSGIVDWGLGYKNVGFGVFNKKGIGRAVLYNSSCRLFEKSTFLMTGLEYFAYTDYTDPDCQSKTGLAQLMVRVSDCWFEDAKSQKTDRGFRNIIYIRSTTHSIIEFNNVGIDQKTNISRYDDNVQILAKCPRIHVYGTHNFSNQILCQRVNNFTSNDIRHIYLSLKEDGSASSNSQYFITAAGTGLDTNRNSRYVASISVEELKEEGFSTIHAENSLIPKRISYIGPIRGNSIPVSTKQVSDCIWVDSTSGKLMYALDNKSRNALGESIKEYVSGNIARDTNYRVTKIIDLAGATVSWGYNTIVEFLGVGQINNGTIQITNSTDIRNFRGTANLVFSSGIYGCPRFGNTANRSNVKGVTVGYQYFDTTLGKPIYAKTVNNGVPTAWVDATGTDV